MRRATSISRARLLWLLVVLVALLGGWYLFRPERAFIDTRVDEPLVLVGGHTGLLTGGT
jgi:hypothetical protein